MMNKLFYRILQSKSGLIFFAILAAYNLLLGIYLKDYLVLSPMLFPSVCRALPQSEHSLLCR